jgi:hypothetical protein
VKSKLEEEEIILKDNEEKVVKHNQQSMKQVYEPELGKSIITLMQEEDMQQKRRSDNNDIQPRTKLDKELIDCGS